MKTKLGIGLMSGTSLDGLDICLAEYKIESSEFKIIKAETIGYSSYWYQKLKDSVLLSAEELTELNVEYGFFLGDCVNQFIHRNNIRQIDFIASHGHTVFHNPEKKYTLQIGRGEAIFSKTGIPVIYDFRTADVIYGGQGAPLVPIGDENLFSGYDACLNLGGFSNISFKRNQKRIAFDICPVNIVLNRLAEKLGQEFDKDGLIARKGVKNKELTEKLDRLEFYRQEPPKSLGIEWCNENIFPLLSAFDESVENIISSFTEHISNQISAVLNQNQIKNVLITGGGVYNKYLIELLTSKTETEIIIPEKEIIEYKEALIFGWMGLLRLENQINVLSSVTGSIKNHSAGIIVA